jgi:hypothetical protein
VLVQAEIVTDLVVDGLAYLLGQGFVVREVTHERSPVDRDAVGQGAVVGGIAAGEGDALVEAVEAAVAEA